MTNYAVLRNKKLALSDRRWSKISAANGHNKRIESQMVNEKDKEHVNPELSKYNQHTDFGTGKTIKERIQNRIKEAGVSRKVTPDAVVLCESIMTTSRDYWGENWQSKLINDDQAFKDKLTKWKNKSVKAAERFFGKENIISVDLHLDETTPHIHITAVPIIQHNNKTKLAAKYLMTPANLRQYQTDYANDMAEFDLVRGVEGSTAKHQHFTEFKQQEELRSSIEAEVKKDYQDKINEHTANAYQAGRRQGRSDIDVLTSEKDIENRVLMVENDKLRAKVDELTQKNAQLLQENADLNEKVEAYENFRPQKPKPVEQAPAVQDSPSFGNAMSRFHDKERSRSSGNDNGGYGM